MVGGENFSYEGLGRLKTFLGPIRSYTVKKNHIGPAVSEILQSRETDTDLLLSYKD